MKNKIVFLFFFLLLCIGLNIFRDYGVPCDEVRNRSFGDRWENYASAVAHTGSFSVPFKYKGHDLTHGPIFEISLVFLTKVFRLTDPRDILFMRHLSVFLLFYIGTICFYLLCLRHFNSWRLALLGSLFLVLSPRIFAEAFYNTVDIAFMVFFVISMFTLLLALDKRSFLSIAVHALMCAILINVRLIGLILPIFTIIFFCLEFVYTGLGQDKIAGLRIFVIYVLLLVLLTVILNPILWLHPLGNFIWLINSAKNYTFDGRCDFYLGRYRLWTKQPWHYAPVWMAVTTPLIYTALFCIGCVDSVKLFFRNTFVPYLLKRNTAIFLLWFFFPLVMSKGRIYDAWRHIYFIYPAFLIVALMGVRYIWKCIVELVSKKISPIMRIAFIILLVFSLFDTAFFMFRNHPYQNLYFNALVGKNIDDAKKNFTLDYWGLSYRKALEYILKNDRSQQIPVSASNQRDAIINADILPNADRERIIFVPVNRSKYFLTNDMQNPYPHDFNEKYYGDEYYSIKVDGMKIMVIYKLNPGNELLAH